MMNEFKGTLGPLTVVEDGKWPFMIRIVDVNGAEVHSEDRIAHTTKWKSLDDVYRAIGWPWDERDNVIALIERQMADIRLRAAGPDLLDALMLMVETFANPEAGEVDRILVSTDARNAIAKALG